MHQASLTDLFTSEQENLLPCDGTVLDFGAIRTCAQADHDFQCLQGQVAWQRDQIRLFGKTIVTKRQVAWYGDQAFTYAYSGSRKTALPWFPDLEALKTAVEDACHATFNTCLLNFYEDGQVGMDWHADDEKELEPEGSIASLSLGARRKFTFKHKSKDLKVALWLEHGSLIIMKDETQAHWLHCLPKSAKVKEPRINLTFRTIRQ